MSWEYLHLVTHPFPVVLAVTGLAVGLAGWLAGRERLEWWALISLLVSGAAAPVAYYTGIAAADTAARRTFVAPSLVQTHRSWATWATVLLVTTAVFAGFALWQDRGRPEDRRLRRFVLLLGAGAVGLSAYAAWLGGGIIHRDAGPSPSADAPAETAARIRPADVRLADVRLVHGEPPDDRARFAPSPDLHTPESRPWHAPSPPPVHLSASSSSAS